VVVLKAAEFILGAVPGRIYPDTVTGLDCKMTITGHEGTALTPLEEDKTTVVSPRKMRKLVGKERVFVADQERLFYRTWLKCRTPIQETRGQCGVCS